MPSNELLNKFWLRMIVKYPTTWKKDYLESPFADGNLTLVASEWSDQLAGLTPHEIKEGIDKLAHSDFKVFPPNAMSFRNLCVTGDYEGVLDCIMCRLQEGERYEWKNKLAFNFWSRYSFDLLAMKTHEIPKLVKQNINLFDKNSLMPLPDYNLQAIENKEPKKIASTIATEREVIIFQSHMTKIIYDFNDMLFRSNKMQSASEREINREPTNDLPPLMKKIFSRQGTLNLIQKFRKQGYKMPEIIRKPVYQIGEKAGNSKAEYKNKRRVYLDSIRQQMTKFLTKENII